MDKKMQDMLARIDDVLTNNRDSCVAKPGQINAMRPKRIGVAKGKFKVPDNIDTRHVDVSKQFE